MKIIRHKFYDGLYTAGFQTRGAAYGHVGSGKYSLEIYPDLGLFEMTAIHLYYGDTKPMFRNIRIVAALAYLLFPATVVLTIVYGLFAMYLSGGRNFVKDCAWVQNVRFFNWANIVIILLLTILLIIK